MSRFATLSTQVVAATLALVLNATASHAQAQGSKAPKPPLTLLEQGTFHVGGTIEFRDPNSSTLPGTGGNVPGDIAVNHMYVQYQIPAVQKYRFPVIMVHGGGHTAKTYETTPDGREGWFTTFTRRGFSPYAVDAPNRGRSGYDPTHTETIAKFDGKDYPVQGAQTADTRSFKRIDDHTWEVVDKTVGKVMLVVKILVARDGKTWTTTQSGKNAQGQAVKNTLVYDRQ